MSTRACLDADDWEASEGVATDGDAPALSAVACSIAASSSLAICRKTDSMFVMERAVKGQ